MAGTVTKRAAAPVGAQGPQGPVVSGSTTVQLGSFSSQTQKDIQAAPSGIIADIVGVAKQLSAAAGLSASQTSEVERVSVATADQESGFNSTAVGDNGTSHGLFQLHQGGELDNLPGTPAQRVTEANNPVTNATQAISEIIATAKSTPGLNDGELAAAAQRPADKVGYANSINAKLTGNTGAPGLQVSVPNGLSAAHLADTSGVLGGPSTVGTGNAGGQTSASSGLNTGLLAKVGGYLVALVLLGVGIVILFRPAGNVQSLPLKAAKAAAA